MRAFGYEDREWPEDEEPHSPFHLREASLLVSDADDLLRIQRFVSGVLTERMSNGSFESDLGWHDHLRDRDPEWTESESDLIIALPAERPQLNSRNGRAAAVLLRENAWRQREGL